MFMLKINWKITFSKTIVANVCIHRIDILNKTAENDFE